MTGAGEAQCHPMTRSGRSVAAASAAIGSPDVFDARIVARRREPVELAEHADLQLEPLGDGFDDEIGRGRRFERRRERDARQGGVGLLAGHFARAPPRRRDRSARW